MPGWHVLGAGSLGGLWACRLAGAGVPVTLLLRSDERLAQYQAAGGLSLEQGGATRCFSLQATTLQAPGVIHHLLLACKAYDAEAAAAALRPHLAADAQVLMLQNGLGSQAAVQRQLPQARCIAVSSTEGAFRRADWQVVHAGAGDNWLGDDGPPPTWLTRLHQAGIPAQWSPDITARLWRKLAINCAINPLTVLLGCRNGELAQHVDRVAPLCEELTQLLHAKDVASAADGLLANVQQVIAATAANYSSMYQDVARGQRTEVAFLLGHALSQATALGLALPALTQLHHELLAHLQARGLPTL